MFAWLLKLNGKP
jgi:hypothetical protein